MSRIQRAADRVVPWIAEHAWALLAVAFVIAVPSVFRTIGLYTHLRSDLDALLPPDAPSVRAIDELRERLGGTTHLAVVVDTGNPTNAPRAEAMLDDLAERIRRYPPSVARILAVQTGFAAERAFFEKHAAVYVDLSDLEQLRDQIAARRDYEVEKATGQLFDDEGPPPVDLAPLREKYERRFGDARFRGDRFLSEDGRTAVLLVAVTGADAGTATGERLIHRIRADLADLGGPDAYAPGMSLGFAGDLATRVEELDGLVVDLTISSILVVVVVSLVIVLYYRWWRALVVLGVPLVVGTSAAFAVATLPPFSIRALNSNTAFLGAIIIGNGLNAGVILVARYMEERRRGLGLRSALVVATGTTARATATASAAAALAYGSLLVTRFRGFNQFGWIGGMGMIFCWVATLVLAPALIALLDHDGTVPRARRSRRDASGPLGVLVRLIKRFPIPILVVAACFTAGGIFALATADDTWIETNYSKLRRRDTWTHGERFWGAKMDKAMGRSLTPIVFLTDGPAETRRVSAELRALAAGELKDALATVVDFEDLVPDDQADKLRVARQIRKMLTPRLLAEIPDKDRARLDPLLAPEALLPVTPAELPITIAGPMREKDGRIDRTVLLFQRPSPKNWEGATVRRIAIDLREAAARAALPGETPPQVAGALPLSYDILTAIGRDGAIATAVSLGLVMALVVIAFGLTIDSALVMASIATGVLWLVGLLRLFDVKLNFANFVAFPVTFGIGADYAVNVIGRYRADGRRDILGAVRHTGGAVVLASATTVIGYASLLVAKNRALFLFGVVAVLGELCCVVTSIAVLPSALRALERRRRREGRGARRLARIFRRRR
jgi:predicted RND superfamily exporter protein